MRVALILYVGWTVTTFLLEGWPRTLLRPHAVELRVAYALAANIVVGTLLAGLALRRLVRQLPLTEASAGFGPARRTLVAVPIGILLGAALYVVQGGPTHPPVVFLNAYAQTVNVTIAEVMVCWSVVGTAWLEAAGGARWRWAPVTAGLASAFAFGVYHVAHSPPFNTLAMVMLLTAVGGMTSLFFVLSRDIYGTIVFHNFLAVIGVVGTLAEAGHLEGYETVHVPLIALALASLAALAVTHAVVVNRWPR